MILLHLSGFILKKVHFTIPLPKTCAEFPKSFALITQRATTACSLEIVCKDINQLRFVLHDELQKIKGIERTETFISLEEDFYRNVQVAPAEKS